VTRKIRKDWPGYFFCSFCSLQYLIRYGNFHFTCLARCGRKSHPLEDGRAVNLEGFGGESKASASPRNSRFPTHRAIIAAPSSRCSQSTLPISTSPPRQEHHHSHTSHYISFVCTLTLTTTDANKAVLLLAIPPAGRPRQPRRGKDRFNVPPSWPPPLYGVSCSLEWPCGMRRAA
jgi:hypothetical protein